MGAANFRCENAELIGCTKQINRRNGRIEVVEWSWRERKINTRKEGRKLTLSQKHTNEHSSTVARALCAAVAGVECRSYNGL